MLRQWLQDEGIVVEPHYNLPYKEDCEKLAQAIAGFRQFVEKLRKIKRLMLESREVEVIHALHTLADVLPEWEDALQDLQEFRADVRADEMEEEFQAIRGLRLAIDDVLGLDLGLDICRMTSLSEWKLYSQMLMDDFVKVMQPTNPGRTLGKSKHTGPVGKFLEGVIPHISGEILRAPNIMQQLRGARSGKNL